MNSLQPGLFNRYVELREIGAGGMARVVLAYDCLLDRHVALKLLRTGEPELMQRLVNEARITARCHHDNVVAIHEVGHQNGCPYIVLEYLRGKPLSALLEEVWRLPYPRAVELVVPVLQALQHIHEIGVVHRDVKPDNIFVLESGSSKLLDFGIAKLLPHARGGSSAPPATFTRAGMIVGTYEYMSPEQWSGVEIDPLTDIWACGIVLFETICGRHPLHPRDGMQLLVTGMLDTPMPSMAEAAPAEVPHELIAVVDRCLYKPKHQRWQSANDLLAALSPFRPSSTPPIRGIDPSDALTLLASHSGPDIATPRETAIRARGSRREADSHDERTMVDAWTAQRMSPLPSATLRPQRSIEPPPAAVAPPELVVRPEIAARSEETHAILFLAADPSGTEQSTLDRQAHDIQVELERSGWRDQLKLVTQWAPESLDLLRALRRGPAIVHFAGTGTDAADPRHGQALIGDRRNGLFLRGRDGRPRLVTATALDQTFGAAGRSVKVVVMSCCYSPFQADALLLHVDCVVGMPAAHPEVAKAYAIGFYGALGERESVAIAHQQGCAAVALEGHDTDGFELRTRAGVDPRALAVPAR